MDTIVFRFEDQELRSMQEGSISTLTKYKLLEVFTTLISVPGKQGTQQQDWSRMSCIHRGRFGAGPEFSYCYY